jgi:hypothetical protein
MTYPARWPNAERIRNEHPELDITVVMDPDPSGMRSSLRTARRAWAAVAPQATHHLVFEDDVVVPPQFAAELYHAVSARPDDALSLYSSWGSRCAQAARIAALARAPWVEVMPGYVPAQALVMPAEMARGLAAFLEKECTNYEFDDLAIYRYLAAVGQTALLAVANLVDTLDLPSLHGQDHDVWGPRISGCFLPNPADRSDFPDWTGPVLRPNLVPYLPRAQYLSRPVCLVRSSAEDAWKTVGAIEYLLSLRVTPQELMDELMAALAAASSGAMARGEIGLGPLHDLWLVVCLLGVAWAQTAPGAGGTALGRAMSTSVARRSLSSTAQGVLGDRIDRSTLARSEAALDSLVRFGVSFGARRADRVFATVPANSASPHWLVAD